MAHKSGTNIRLCDHLINKSMFYLDSSKSIFELMFLTIQPKRRPYNVLARLSLMDKVSFKFRGHI